MSDEYKQADGAQGEREAFESRFPIPEGIEWRNTDYYPMPTDDVGIYVGLAGVAARYSAKWEAWQARASLAQPSPVINYALLHVYACENNIDYNVLCAVIRDSLEQPSLTYDSKRCLVCGGGHGNSGLSCPNMRVTAENWSKVNSRVEMELQNLREELRVERAKLCFAEVEIERNKRTIAGMNEAHAKLAGLYEAVQAGQVPEWVAQAVVVLGKAKKMLEDEGAWVLPDEIDDLLAAAPAQGGE